MLLIDLLFYFHAELYTATFWDLLFQFFTGISLLYVNEKISLVKDGKEDYLRGASTVEVLK